MSSIQFLSRIALILLTSRSFADWSVGDSITFRLRTEANSGMYSNESVQPSHVSSIHRQGDTSHYEFTVDSCRVVDPANMYVPSFRSGSKMWIVTSKRTPAGVRIWSEDLAQCSWILPDSHGIFLTNPRFPTPLLHQATWYDGMPLYVLRVNDTFGIRCTAYVDYSSLNGEVVGAGVKSSRIRYLNRQDTIGTVMNLPKAFREKDAYWTRSSSNPFGIGQFFPGSHHPFADTSEITEGTGGVEFTLENYVPVTAALAVKPRANVPFRQIEFHDALGRTIRTPSTTRIILRQQSSDGQLSLQIP